MKVFELMSELSKMPSGAEVKFRTLMPIEELIKNGVETEIEGKDHYSLCKSVVEVEQSESGTVCLYSD